MPDNPNTWINTLNSLPAEIAGVLMAMFIAVLRVIYDKEETKPIRIMLEALICGTLSLTASSAIIAMKLDVNWAVFVGGVIGYFGSATVRAIAVKFINSKVNKDK